jgi:ribosomal protein L35AE/L33A
MPDAIITSTASTFGTITGTFEADQSTVIGTITGIVAGTLDGSVGVPGQQGIPGPQGPQGVPGEGVPANGLEGQILLKASDTSYDTVWADNYANAVKATVRNESGATMTKGTVVYISGASGNKAVVSKASASTEAGSSKTFAILEEDIPTNQNGTAITMGLLKGVDTSTFSPGANLWLSVTPGQITQTPPAAPYHAVFLGNAVRIHVNQGEIEVRIQNGLEIQELHNVSITTPTNGQVLKYDATTSLWKNQTDLNSGVWGSITGTLSSQTDLQSALDGKYSTTNPSGYQTAGQVVTALAPYLLSSTASTTYLTQANAASTYYPASNPSSFITSSSLAPYLTISGASATYYPLSNPANYITSAALTGYATQAWVTSQGYLTASSLTGYATESWVTSQGYLTSSALTPYLTSATASATYQTIAGMAGYATESWVTGQGYLTASALTGYATESWVTAGFYPLTGNPSNFLTSSSLTGYATEAWVTSQGYLTSAPVTSVAGKTGAVTLTNTDISGLGTMATANASDYSTTTVANGLYYPLSSNPAGYLVTAPVTSVAGRTGAITLSNTDISGLGTLATVNDAPSDGSQYARKNGAWDVVTGGSSYITSVSSPLAVSTGNLTVDLSAYAPLASPTFTGTPSLPTGTTAVTQTVGDNSTKIATTAFVLANGGSPTFATAAETLGASITNEVLSPASIPYIMGLPGYRSMNGANVSNGVNGGTLITRGWVRVPYVLTTANARITASSSTYGNDNAHNSLGSKDDPFKIDFSKKCAIWGLFENGAEQGVGGDLRGSVNNTFRVNLGGRSGYASGNLTQKGIGIYMQGGGSSDVYLTVHDGTTLTNVASGFAPARQTVTHYFVYSDGAGNVYLYLNGEYKCQTSLGPTGTTTKNYCVYEEQIESGGTGSSYTACMAGTGVYIQQ